MSDEGLVMRDEGWCRGDKTVPGTIFFDKFLSRKKVPGTA
jgi:hypothetical protein